MFFVFWPIDVFDSRWFHQSMLLPFDVLEVDVLAVDVLELDVLGARRLILANTRITRICKYYFF